MRTSLFAGTALLMSLLVSTVSHAQDDALVTFKVMKPEIAMKLAQAALEACRDEGAQTAIAVVDRFGVLQVLIRDRFAGPHTPETARRKAWTAVSFRGDTLTLSEATKPGSEAYGANFVDGVLMLGGGVPIDAGGTLIGAIGVSGAPSGALDDQCGRAGIAAIEEDIAF